MNIQTWQIGRLKENPQNARGIKKEDFERLKKQINRTCYMMELDPKYCDVIRKRYENYITK